MRGLSPGAAANARARDARALAPLAGCRVGEHPELIAFDGPRRDRALRVRGDVQVLCGDELDVVPGRDRGRPAIDQVAVFADPHHPEGPDARQLDLLAGPQLLL